MNFWKLIASGVQVSAMFCIVGKLSDAYFEEAPKDLKRGADVKKELPQSLKVSNSFFDLLRKY